MNLSTSDDTGPTLDAEVIAALRNRARDATPHVCDWAADSLPGTRKGGNQDRWGQRDEQLFVLADGMGGHDHGDLAAEIAVSSVLADATDTRTWRQRLVDADAAVRARNDEGGGSGTTLVAVSYDHGRATVVGVGDSRVYRWRDGLELLTHDHNVRGARLMAGIDVDQRGSRHEARVLTSYVGIGPDHLSVDIVDVPARAGDRLLLCSDGVHGRLPTATIAAALAEPSCRDAVAALLTPIAASQRRDDATAIVLELA